MSKPMKTHFLVAKCILRYIKGKIQYGILFPISQMTEKLELEGFLDDDWYGDEVEREGVQVVTCSSFMVHQSLGVPKRNM